jgi:hypothetical protein
MELLKNSYRIEEDEEVNQVPQKKNKGLAFRTISTGFET